MLMHQGLAKNVLASFFSRFFTLFSVLFVITHTSRACFQFNVYNFSVSALILFIFFFSEIKQNIKNSVFFVG